MKKFNLFLLTLISFFSFMTIAAQSADPPGRVGRLSYLKGTVSFHTADQNQWSLATENYPVTSGISLWTEPGGLAEIQVGSAEVRMDQSTELNFTRLDDSASQLQLSQGVINIHLRHHWSNPVQVMTPLGEIDLVEPGSYNINAGYFNENSSLEQITVLEGKALVVGSAQVTTVLPGERVVLNGNASNVTVMQGSPTAFDNWALFREHREVTPEASLYVSPELTGYVDLDHYGRWEESPSYGEVWYPTSVVAGWAPYRYGHWVYIAPWGWTWVDNAPWGFAPFHYGRWAFIAGRWGWCPGGIVARPVYAPALVAFFGGPGWQLSVSFGSGFGAIGWVPLAPFEVYHPYYPVSRGYERRVNIATVNNTTINNTYNITKNVTINNYANQSAATIVPSQSFAQARPVHQSMLSLSPQQISQAPVANSISHLHPSFASRTGRVNSTPNVLVPPLLAPSTSSRTNPNRTFTNTNASIVEPPRSHTINPSLNSNPPTLREGAAPAPSFHPAITHRFTPKAPTQGANQANSVQRQLPTNPISHPVQQSRITPSPRGWIRVPVVHEPPPPPLRAPQPQSRPQPQQVHTNNSNHEGGRAPSNNNSHKK